MNVMYPITLDDKPYRNYVRLLCDDEAQGKAMLALLDDIWSHNKEARHAIVKAHHIKGQTTILYSKENARAQYDLETHAIELPVRNNHQVLNQNGDRYTPSLREMVLHELWHAQDPMLNAAERYAIFGMPDERDGYVQRESLKIKHEADVEKKRYVDALVKEGAELLITHSPVIPEDSMYTKSYPEIYAILEEKPREITEKLHAIDTNMVQRYEALFSDHPLISPYTKKIETPAIEFANRGIAAEIPEGRTTPIQRRTDYAEGVLLNVPKVNYDITTAEGKEALGFHLSNEVESLEEAGGLNAYLAKEECMYHEKLSTLHPPALLRVQGTPLQQRVLTRGQDTPQAMVKNIEAQGKIHAEKNKEPRSPR